MSLLKGKDVAVELNNALKVEIDKICLNKRKPKLAIILVGNHPASLSYIKGKLSAAKSVGIITELFQLEETSKQPDVLEVIEKLNNDDEVDGMILQLPLPKHLDERLLIDAISQHKDADGFHTVNQGRLYQSLSGIVPATPLGIIKLLEYYQIDVKGLNAVIIGRSNIVGFPVARLLMDRGATITVCHSKTKDLTSHTLAADIIVVAVGKAKMLKEEMVKQGVIVIDVGINRVDGKLLGDVDFEAIHKKASWITPVPKGVGPMTIHGLLSNTLTLYKMHVKI